MTNPCGNRNLKIDDLRSVLTTRLLKNISGSIYRYAYIRKYNSLTDIPCLNLIRSNNAYTQRWTLLCRKLMLNIWNIHVNLSFLLPPHFRVANFFEFLRQFHPQLTNHEIRRGQTKPRVFNLYAKSLVYSPKWTDTTQTFSGIQKLTTKISCAQNQPEMALRHFRANRNYQMAAKSMLYFSLISFIEI